MTHQDVRERVRLKDICDAVKQTLAAADGINRAGANETIPDGTPDLPLVNVFPQTIEGRGRTDRTTFGGGVRQNDVEVGARVVLPPKGSFGEAIALQTEIMDNLIDVFETQTEQPFFGHQGIKTFRWKMERATIKHGDREYPGIEVTLFITLF